MVPIRQIRDELPPQDANPVPDREALERQNQELALSLSMARAALDTPDAMFSWVSTTPLGVPVVPEV